MKDELIDRILQALDDNPLWISREQIAAVLAAVAKLDDD